MKRRALLFVVVSCLLLAGAVGTQAAVDPSVQKQIEATRRERDALLAEQRRLEAELLEVNKQSQSLGSAVKSLDTTRVKLANDIKLTSNRINSANQNIKTLESTMTEKESQIALHRQAIEETIKELVAYDHHTLLADVLTYKEVSEVWRDRGRLSDIGSRLNTEIANLRDTKLALAKEKEAKEKTKQQLVSLSSQLGGQKQVVEETQAAKTALLRETQSKEAEYQRKIAELIEKQKQSEGDLFRLESQGGTFDTKSAPSPQNGILSWPLDNVFVTQRFGRTAGASRLYASGTHNGVDFRASVGTPVKAVLSGVIEGAGNTDEQKGCYSYGRWILIKHSNGLSTVYGHLSGSLVKKGDVVATGQVIGYSGGMPGQFGSGYSTGPHLHIGLLATSGVEVKQFVTSNNCKSVFVPIAKGVDAYLDPLAYLPSL